ncbi:AMP-binding protein [Micromonospora sp. DT46]|uniref:AMP-binding protein n=1 Tax=Micromonospora sp. DT46 TaxID=3393435 RepID=UPI003CEECACD
MSGSSAVPSLLREFEAQVRAVPYRAAVRAPDGQEVRYGELADLVRAGRRMLLAARVGPGTTVRVSGQPTASTVAVMLAAWSLRAVVWLAEPRSGGPAPAAAPPGSAAPSTAGQPVPFVDVRAGVDVPGLALLADAGPLDEQEAAAVADVARQPPRPDDRPAYLVASSGTTGNRKFILGSYRGLSHFVRWQRDRFGIGPGDSVAQLTHVTFDVVLRELVTPLVSGATLLLSPPGLRPGRMLEHLTVGAATVVNVVPSLARLWLQSEQAPAAGVSSPDLRLTFFAGEPLDAALAARWRARTGRRQAVVNLYGPSETTLASFHWVVPPDVTSGPCPVGAPIPGASYTLVDPERRAGPGAGGVGEVVIRTPHASFGYLGARSPEQDHAYRHEGGIATFHTGDLGRVQDGVLRLIGRTGTTMKINGRWVDRAALESLLTSLAGVHEAIALPLRTPQGWRVRVFLVAATPIDPQDVRRLVLRALGSASVPAAVTVVAELPRLATGKIALAELLRCEPTHKDQGETMTGQPSVPGHVLSEQAILGSVRRTAATVLGQEVPADEDLFDAGLDSLSALEISASVEEEFQVDCYPEDIFEHPVPTALARFLLARAGGA